MDARYTSASSFDAARSGACSVDRRQVGVGIFTYSYGFAGTSRSSSRIGSVPVMTSTSSAAARNEAASTHRHRQLYHVHLLMHIWILRASSDVGDRHSVSTGGFRRIDEEKENPGHTRGMAAGWDMQPRSTPLKAVVSVGRHRRLVTKRWLTVDIV